MILYAAVTAVTVLFACLISKKSTMTEYGISQKTVLNRVCMLIIFSILFFVSAFRIEVGNDYGTYVTTCHEIYQKGYVVTEPGYNLVVRILYTLSGKEDYLLMFAFFAFITVFLFLKIFAQQSDHFAWTFFLFMTLGIYFRTFNTVRYYFVLALSLYSMKYVLKKEYGKFVILILLGALFHKSVLFVLPVYFLANHTFKKYHYILFTVLAAAGYLCKDQIMQIALKLYPSYVNTPYLENLDGSIMGIIRCVAVLILCLVCYKEGIKDNRANVFYANLTFFALLLYACGSFIPLLSRFSYYLITAQILLIPGLLVRITDLKKKKLLSVLTVVVSLLYFALFLKTGSQDGIRVLPYKSWLFYGREWLDATQIF